uniref:FH2 domain-containing protein n=1 Tax=Strongyloides venezuelensis TaxID=75913 RepID=A0A0K0FDV9_STRVS
MFSGHPILAEIRQGTRLRPTKTVDKSKPVIVADGETLNTILDESKAPTKTLNCENSLSSNNNNNNNGPPPPPPPMTSSGIPPPPPIGGKIQPKNISNKPVNTKFQGLGGKVTVDQDEFIKSIQNGFKLKPTVTNDKSGLIFDDEQLEIINAAKNASSDGSEDGKRKVLIEFKKPQEDSSQPPPPPPMMMNVPMPPPPPGNMQTNNVPKKPTKPITNPKLLKLGGGTAANVDKDEFLNSIKGGFKLKKVEVVEKNSLYFDEEELQHLSKVRDETKASSSNLSSYTASSENLFNSSHATSTSSLLNGDNFSSTSSLMDGSGSFEPVKKKEFKWKVRDVKEETPPAHIDAGWNLEEKKWNPEKMTDEIPKGSAKARIAMLAKLTSSNESLASNGSSGGCKFKPSVLKKDLFEKKEETTPPREVRKEIRPVKKLDYKMFENSNNNSTHKADDIKVAKKLVERSKLEDSFDFDGITLNEDEADEIMKEAMRLEEKPIPKPLDKSLYEAKFGGSCNSLIDSTYNDRKDRDITPKPLDRSFLASPFINNTTTELPSSAQPSPRASPGRFDRGELEAKFGGGNPLHFPTEKEDIKPKKEITIKIEPQNEEDVEKKKVIKKIVKKKVTPPSSKLNILPSNNGMTNPKVAVNGKIKISEELNTPLSIDTKNNPLKTGNVSAMRNQFQKSVTPSPQSSNTLGTSSPSVKSRSLSPLAVETSSPTSPSLSQYKTAPTSAVSCRTINTNSESSTPISLSPVSSTGSIGGRKNSSDDGKESSVKAFGRYNPKAINSNSSRFEELRKSFNVKKDDMEPPKFRVSSASPLSGEHIWKQAIKEKNTNNNLSNNNNNNNSICTNNGKDGVTKNRAVPIKLTNEYKRFR